MNVLVTGGGGYLGLYIVKSLLKQKYHVTNLSRKEYTSLVELEVKTLKCDLSDKAQVEKIDLAAFDAIIHTAALTGVWGDAAEFLRINYQGSQNLLAHAKSSGIKYFIYTSSPSVVFGKDNLINADETTLYPAFYYTDYAKTKAMAEEEILNASNDDFQCMSIRPHLIWGPGDPHLFPRILQKARAKKLKQVGDGDNLVDITYVENAANAHTDLLTAVVAGKKLGGNAYFIGQERAVNLWSFINEIITINKVEPVDSMISFKMAFIMGAFLEKIYKLFGILKPEPPMSRFVALQLAKSHYFSHAKAQKDFGYCAKITIEEGIKKTYPNM